jgi:hypothetical protein
MIIHCVHTVSTLLPRFALLAALVAGLCVPTLAQHPAMPAGISHAEHLAEMQKDADLKARGAKAMGFDQDAVSHHFLLAPDGGTIEVEVRGDADAATRDAFRRHLRQIAAAFGSGDFDAPFATHAEVPDGVPTLERLKDVISYAFSETASGARVRITTTNEEARQAVYAFLRYQIREHHTGDSQTAPKGDRPRDSFFSR